MAAQAKLFETLVRNPKLVGGGGAFVSVAGAAYLYLRSQSEDLSKDLRMGMRIGKMRRFLQSLANKPEWSLVDFWDETVARNADDEAIVFIDTKVSYTYRQVDEISNKIANWAVSEGLKKGDTVALLMDSKPEYVFTWLGLAKAGIITALINHNLTGRPLLHSLTVCGANYFLLASDLATRVLELGDGVKGKLYSYGEPVEGMIHLDPLLNAQPTTPLPRSVRAGITAKDTLLYIYTSGTTGNPKASIITHLRFLGVGHSFKTSFGVRKSDRIYCTLPLYHSAGGMAGVGMSWISGGTLVLRSKFSVSKFWEDIHNYKCNVFQYIGELCRYLLAQPPGPYDKSNIRLVIGNGLRPDIWDAFKTRFNIKQIGEFYGATEGNAGLVNYHDRTGAIGYIPPFAQRFMPIVLVKFDVETEEVVRGPDGFCIPCAPGEPGELISLIIDGDATQSFVGYTDKAATEKKILRDAFVKGDRYFRSGDLLSRDKRGFYFFVDRIGDTFRWKGENVSTGEVALVLSDIKGVKEANVYGVTIPGCDGRAGMSTLVTDPNVFDFAHAYQRIEAELPSYARPVFLRIQPEIEITGTFKHLKFNLQKEGFNPSTVADPIYFRDDTAKTYVRLTPQLYEQIVGGALKARL